MSIERIERISGGKLALVVSRSELETDNGLDMEKAHALAEEAFEKNGLTIDGHLHMELEAFTGAGTVLIFASILDDDYYACRFDSFDELAEAARWLDMKASKAELLTIEGSYIAVASKPFPFGISEFGTQYSLQTAQKAWLEEHGTLLSCDIFSRLRFEK